MPLADSTLNAKNNPEDAADSTTEKLKRLPTPSLRLFLAAPLAVWIALSTALALYGGALIAQFGFGLLPCQLCYWQRWPHQAAIVLAVLALLLHARSVLLRTHSTTGAATGAATGTATDPVRWLTLLAALAIATSGAIAAFHAGAEYRWWQGLSQCSTNIGSGFSLDALEVETIIRCDVPQWKLGPLSLAGFNAIFSFIGAGATGYLLTYTRKTHTRNPHTGKAHTEKAHTEKERA